jgi:putative transposase
VKYAWIARHAQQWPVAKLCRALDVSASGFKAWRGGGKRCTEHLSDAHLLLLIRAIHAELKGTYGSPRMLKELRERGHRVGKTRVERVMRDNGIRARHKRRWRATTDSKHALPVAANLLARDFSPSRPNQSWGADISVPQQAA